MINDSVYQQISSHSSHSNAFKLRLQYNLKLMLVEMKAATWKNIAEYSIRPAKMIPASHVMVHYAALPMRIVTLWRDSPKMKEWLMRPQVGKRFVVVSMCVLIE
jgi:hypothetical protein